MKFPYRLLLCCVLVAGAHVAPALAQTAPPPPAAVSPAAASPAPPAGTPLSLDDAEKIALANHPQVQVAKSLASAAEAQVREARSAYYPNIYGSLTGADAENDSRVAAGALNNPIVYDRFAAGVTASQLVTDFGRTHELVKSSNLRAQAQEENVVTTRADVLVQVDSAFYAALRAQALLQVAQETVQNRQLVVDQITALAKSQLKSDLDVSFANVDLAQAQLLLIQSQNDVQSAFAQLSYALGYPDQRNFQLTQQSAGPMPPPDVNNLIQQALANRPELIGQRLDVRAAQTYATAERDLYFPTISAVGVAGTIPFREAPLEDRYAAAGFNVNIPIFNGRLYGALHAEAQARAEAESQSLRDLTDRIVRDVRTSWLNANSGFQRLSVTDQLLAQATQTLKLAQSRYQLGLSSIIELSQSQLNLTQAEIADASAKYDYQTQQSVLNYEAGLLR